MHGDSYLETCWITKVPHAYSLIGAQYSDDNNEEESAAILTDLKRLIEGLENKDQENTDIIMYQDE